MMPARTRAAGCLGDLRFDQLLAGELDGDTRVAAEHHIEGCAACRQLLAALQRDRDSFRARRPPLVRRGRIARRRLTVAAVGCLAAAALLLVLRGGFDRPGARVKGGPGLGLWVKRNDQVWRGAAREVVYPGDALRFTFTSRESGYLAVVSRDGGGQVNIYHPDGTIAAPIAAGNEVPLPGSIVLDQVVGPETLYVLFCSRPISLEPVQRALAERGHLADWDDCKVGAVMLDKREDK